MATKPTPNSSQFVEHVYNQGKSRFIECQSCGKVWIRLSENAYLKQQFGISIHQFAKQFGLLKGVVYLDGIDAAFKLLRKFMDQDQEEIMQTHICDEPSKSKIIDVQVSNLIGEFDYEDPEFTLNAIDASIIKISDMKRLIHNKYKYPTQQIAIFKHREDEDILMDNDHNTLEAEEIEDEEVLFWALNLDSPSNITSINL